MTPHVRSVAATGARGVADDVALIAYRGPAGAADQDTDARRSVTIAIPELSPYRLRVDFLVYMPASRMVDMTYEYIPVGHALELRGVSIGRADRTDPAEFRREHERVLDLFLRRSHVYMLLAELKARGDNSELDRIRSALKAGVEHRYLPLLVAVWRSTEGSSARRRETARAFSIDETTVWRGLTKALDQGLISEAELPPRRS